MGIDPNLAFYINVFIAAIVLPFWFIRVAKGVWFYVYLWQLKEYHVGRFIDHFSTSKGKTLIFNKIVLGKFILFLLAVPPVVLLLYMLEAFKTLYDILKNRIRKPVPTKKTSALIIMNVGVFLLFSAIVLKGIRDGNLSAAAAVRTLLLIDIFTPIIVSAVALAFQPFAVISRNRIIREAKERREEFKKLKVIGITGSYGKTSTKEFLTHMLGQKFQVLKTPEHQNSEVGISNTILRSLTDEHDIFICEMGAYNKGGIKLLADIVKPDMGIVTGTNEQHLATFGSMENLLSAEGGKELIEALPKDGVAIINGGSVKLKEYIPSLKKINEGLKFVIGTEDIQAKNINIEKEMISFEVEGTQFKVKVCGGHNTQNLLLAIAGSKEMGMGLEEIAKACETITPELGALKVKKGINGITVIDSTYSANPDGVIADLEYLKLWEGKKMLIMPCLIELGKASKEVHQRIGEKIAQVCDLAIITTKEHFDDLREGAGGSDKVIYKENAQEIMEKIKSSTTEEAAVLLEGGKESRLQKQLLYLLQEK